MNMEAQLKGYIHWDKFEDYLRNTLSDLPDGELEVIQFAEGYSNLTYLLKIGGWEAVLRRPPLGKVPPKAHDMAREYKMLEKVNRVFSLAPKPLIYCEDNQIMDKHFYVMERKQGIVIDDVLPEHYGSSLEAGPKISKNVIRTLAELQSIDYKEAGLADMGKPEGFLERQVTGWIKRYGACKTEEIPHAEELQAWLVKHLPVNNKTTIVHNDFKLNNMVMDVNDPGRTVGVLDWELSTIGDPLSDLGSTVAYRGQPTDPDMGINIITNQPGFYTRKQFVEEYAQVSGRDVSQIAYYVSFGFYKLAVILQQIHYRWKIGEIKDDRFEHLNKAVANLIYMANLTRTNQLL